MITHLRDVYRGFLICTDIRRGYGLRYCVTHQQFEKMREVPTRPVKLKCDLTEQYVYMTDAFDASARTARAEIDLLLLNNCRKAFVSIRYRRTNWPTYFSRGFALHKQKPI
ncbi:hypothetical protein [Caballeronia sordidicola]|jgi:hypothetical protein|uniref:Uncharacterized protein n=1 Tax=Caballeronia sordidicola TaxID=196367 RepID=A0A226X6B5_CABSO|nr:hypothetical protein [Caballeronia sordidicola]OXC78398.1 hypothetical protein BSU04_11670 [Caballeronia sordidicola]